MKKGFTLIELLAVIVILAIIALIATPIVLNIISDAKESAQLRSAEMYLKGVETSVATATINNKKLSDGTYEIVSGDICLGIVEVVSEQRICNGETLKVEMNGEKPGSGSITIVNGRIEEVFLTYSNEKTVVKNDGKLVYQEVPTVPTLASCELKSGAAKTIGAKYECDFGDGKRKFYILELGSNPVTGTTLASDEVALILEGNYDTTTQAWCASGSDNSCNADGLTSKLDDIAEAWKELEREQIVLPSALQIIVANDPSKNTVENNTSDIQSWLYNWPDNPDYSGGGAPICYWTSTPSAEESRFAWAVYNDGYVYYDGDDSGVAGGYCGVRPVVNLKI